MPVPCPNTCETCPDCIRVTFSNMVGTCDGEPCADLNGSYDLVEFGSMCIWILDWVEPPRGSIWITCAVGKWNVQIIQGPQCARWEAPVADSPLCPPFGGSPVPWVPIGGTACTGDVVIGLCVEPTTFGPTTLPPESARRRGISDLGLSLRGRWRGCAT